MNGSYQLGDVVFGNWTLVKQLGAGSYGKVFEAERHDFGVTYKAAIKIVTIPQSPSEIEDALAEGMDEKSVTGYFSSVVSELVQEFSLMSKLKGNTNVVSYEDHAVVPHTGGIGWDIMIRMELLTPLIERMKKAAMTRRNIVRLGIDICKALELCGRYNIIHRDIKPENIFISETGDYKLGDFGIARTVDRTTGGLSKKGTYTYMAPEVYREEPYGPTVDICSLGIVLYRLLNGNRAPFLPPYPAVITHTQRETALKRRLMGEPMPAPCDADEKMAAIVLKACSFDPKDRYADPSEMRQALESIAVDEAASPVTMDATEAPLPSYHSSGSAVTDTAQEMTVSGITPAPAFVPTSPGSPDGGQGLVNGAASASAVPSVSAEGPNVPESTVGIYAAVPEPATKAPTAAPREPESTVGIFTYPPKPAEPVKPAEPAKPASNGYAPAAGAKVKTKADWVMKSTEPAEPASNGYAPAAAAKVKSKADWVMKSTEPAEPAKPVVPEKKDGWKKKVIAGAIFSGLLTVLLIVILAVIGAKEAKAAKYDNAYSMYNSGRYAEARAAFRALGDYSSAERMVKQCDYMTADKLLNSGNYEEAKAAFQKLGSYSDSGKMVVECDYRQAIEFMEDGDIVSAENLFLSLDEYSDSRSKFMECEMIRGQMLMDQGLYDDARDVFEGLGTYEPAEAMIKQCEYNSALAQMATATTADEYLELAIRFDNLQSFQEADEMGNECAYMYASLLEPDETGLKDAIDTFGELAENSYRDSFEQMQVRQMKLAELYEEQGRYTLALQAYHNAQYDDSEKRFEAIVKLLQKQSKDNNFARKNDSLLGLWKNGSIYFSVWKNGDHVTSNNRLKTTQGKYFKIENGLYYIGDDDSGWTRQFIFQQNGDDLLVYDFIDNSTAELQKQSDEEYQEFVKKHQD